jgi:uncharacterized protein (DUF433 family)
MTVVKESHIRLDDRGVAYLDGSRTKIRLIVQDALWRGWSPQEIHENYPHLSLAQIHAALAYYYDNKSQLDAEIAAAEQVAEESRVQNESSPGLKKFETHPNGATE